MAQAIVPVVIPYFKAPQQLARCVAALKAGTHSSVELFIRDNSDDNILFTRAINEGLLKYLANPEICFVLILNQDAYVYPDMLARLLDHMESNPRCGIASPLQIADDGASVTWGGALEAFPWGHHRRDKLSAYGPPFETYWAHGAAMLVRMSMLREIGILDANMRFIFSDVDISYTARSRGWQVVVLPAARTEHSTSSSGHGGSQELNLVKIQDALYFAEKWITADVFRRLDFHGTTLSGADAKFEIDRMRAVLQMAGRA